MLLIKALNLIINSSQFTRGVVYNDEQPIFWIINAAIIKKIRRLKKARRPLEILLNGTTPLAT